MTVLEKVMDQQPATVNSKEVKVPLLVQPAQKKEQTNDNVQEAHTVSWDKFLKKGEKR